VEEGDPDAPSSPVCYAAEADDVYMGYAVRDEILVLLTDLLRREDMVGRDEAVRAVLTAEIRRLGGTPPEPGDLRAARAVPAADVLRRLADLLPRLRDDGLHAVLRRLVDR
jgi:hypothetical protein